jgi:hypothetical protein
MKVAGTQGNNIPHAPSNNGLSGYKNSMILINPVGSIHPFLITVQFFNQAYSFRKHVINDDCSSAQSVFVDCDEDFSYDTLVYFYLRLLFGTTTKQYHTLTNFIL